MESWQRDHIQSNLVELIKNTKCNTIFNAVLVSKKTLTTDEVDKMEPMSPCEKSKFLYEILQTRTGAFNILVQAIEETQQSGALEILKRHEPKCQKHELISYDQNSVLGKGSYGSVVYKGIFDHRDVAVKVLNAVQINLEKAVKEVDFLKMLDDHENIIRYFYAEKHENFIYIALELFVINLHDNIKLKLVDLSAQEIIWKCTNGLAHLHSHKILHRDLKPGNILLNRLKQVKISDFGLSKIIPDGETSVSVSGAVGTIDWMAPEVLQLKMQNEYSNDEDQTTMTTSSDIFSLGCIFYFVLSNGQHPFGTPLDRQYHISRGMPQLDSSAVPQNLLELVKQMISHSPKDRPNIQDVLKNDLFELQISLKAMKVVELEALENTEPIFKNDSLHTNELSLKAESEESRVGNNVITNTLAQTVNTILSFKLEFQGKLCTFDDIGIYEIDLREILKTNIYQDEIHQIMKSTEKKIILANDMVPPAIDIRRKISNELYLNPKIYKERNRDIFVFKGFKITSLSKLVAPNIPSLSGSQLQNITSRFIFLEDIQHWEKIRKISKYPVHLIKAFHILEEVSYDNDNITNYAHEDYNMQMFLTAKEFFSETMNDKVITICDSVGTGKTSYLENLARHVNQQFEKRIVIYESLSSFAESLRSVDFASENLLTLICERIAFSPLSRAILSRLLLNKKLMIQMFLHGVIYTSIQNVHMTKTFVDTLTVEGFNVQIFIACGVDQFCAEG